METDPPNLGSPLTTWHGRCRDGEGAAGSGEEVILLQKKGAEAGWISTADLTPFNAFRGGPQPGPCWGQDTTSPIWRVSLSTQTLHEALFSSPGDFRAAARLSAPKQSYKKAERDPRLIQRIPPREESRFSRGGPGLRFQRQSQALLSQSSLVPCQLDALRPSFTGKAPGQEEHEASPRSSAPKSTKRGIDYVNGGRGILQPSPVILNSPKDLL